MSKYIKELREKFENLKYSELDIYQGLEVDKDLAKWFCVFIEENVPQVLYKHFEVYPNLDQGVDADFQIEDWYGLISVEPDKKATFHCNLDIGEKCSVYYKLDFNEPSEIEAFKYIMKSLCMLGLVD